MILICKIIQTGFNKTKEFLSSKKRARLLNEWNNNGYLKFPHIIKKDCKSRRIKRLKDGT
jgi:hypothetical protein